MDPQIGDLRIILINSRVLECVEKALQQVVQITPPLVGEVDRNINSQLSFESFAFPNRSAYFDPKLTASLCDIDVPSRATIV